MVPAIDRFSLNEFLNHNTLSIIKNYCMMFYNLIYVTYETSSCGGGQPFWQFNRKSLLKPTAM